MYVVYDVVYDVSVLPTSGFRQPGHPTSLPSAEGAIVERR